MNKEMEEKYGHFMLDMMSEYNKRFIKEEKLEGSLKEKIIIKETLLEYLKLRDEYRLLLKDYDEFSNENNNEIDEILEQEFYKLGEMLINAEHRISYKYFEYFLKLLDQSFQVHDMKMKNYEESIKEHDKNILNMMGIFLAIFSLIGINISFFTGSLGKNLEICDFLKYLAGINLILVIAIMTVFEMIKRYTKNR